jgi:hypothetical protein
MASQSTASLARLLPWLSFRVSFPQGRLAYTRPARGDRLVTNHDASRARPRTWTREMHFLMGPRLLNSLLYA